MPAELSGLDLDRAIAEAQGWRTDGFMWAEPSKPYEYGALPHYSTSLDAQRTGPWKMLRERGLTSVYREWADGLCQWMWYRHEDEEVAEGEAPDFDIALAAARATLAALEAMKDGTPT